MIINQEAIKKTLEDIKEKLENNKENSALTMRELIISEFHKRKPDHIFFYVSQLETGKYDKSSKICTVSLGEFTKLKLTILNLGNDKYRIAADIEGYLVTE